MSNFIRPFCAGLVAVLMLSVVADHACADGLVYRPIAYQGSLNERSQEAIIIFNPGDKPGEATEDLIIKISVEGDTSDFGWVVPLPSVPKTAKEDGKLFAELHKYVQMRLAASSRGKSKGEASKDGSVASEREPTKAVEVIERKIVGSFDVSIVKENVAGSLNQWLADNKYQPVAGSEKVVEWYRRKGYVFACVRVSDTALTKGKTVDVHPLRFSFKTGGQDSMYFPMRLTGLQDERFDVNLYIFFDKWINDQLSPFGYVHRDFNLRWRDYDSSQCIANAGKLWATPDKDPYLRGYAHVMPTVTKLFAELHPKRRYYLTNIYARSMKPADVLQWKDDLWVFPYYINRNFVPFDAREGGVAAMGYR